MRQKAIEMLLIQFCAVTGYGLTKSISTCVWSAWPLSRFLRTSSFDSVKTLFICTRREPATSVEKTPDCCQLLAGRRTIVSILKGYVWHSVLQRAVQRAQWTSRYSCTSLLDLGGTSLVSFPLRRPRRVSVS